MRDGRNHVIHQDAVTAVWVAGALAAAWYLREALLMIYVGVIFAVVFSPGVDWIQRRRIGRWSPGRGLALLLLLGAAVAAAGLFIALALPAIISDSQSLSEQLPQDIRQLTNKVRGLPFGDRIAAQLNAESLQRAATSAVGTALKVFQSVTGAVTGFLTIALLAAYFILDGRQVFQWALRFFPAGERDRLRRTSLRARDSVQRWLRGQVMLMIILGSSSTLVFALLGVRYFYAIGLFAGVANFVPVLGPFISVALAVLIAVLDGWTKVLGVLIFYLVYQQIENAYLTPRIVGSSVGLPGVAILVALVIGSKLAGVIGAVVAVPTAAIIAIFADEYWQKERPVEPVREPETVEGGTFRK